jgi:hypothetical protein
MLGETLLALCYVLALGYTISFGISATILAA